MATFTSVRQMRAAFDQVLDRAREDPEFEARLNRDPEGVFTEVGLPSKAITEIRHEIRQLQTGSLTHEHVLARRAIPCDYTSCWATFCMHWGTTVTGCTGI